jgi:L-ascorbate metabolism protein UlaG (beta-lactamase superfamily)
MNIEAAVMPLSQNAKIIITVVIVATVAVAVPVIGFSLMQPAGVRLQLLDNAGVMLEYNGYRIYVDPINLPVSYGELPADVVLVTHSHGDHYQPSSINLVQKEGTINVFPANMSAEIAVHEGIGVTPRDELVYEYVTITAFFMYTFDVGGGPASHPQEAELTSYIIEFGGVTFFHAGDSKNIPEYSELTGTIDVAMLPLGPGCQTMYNEEVVDALGVIQPRYFIPIHYAEGANIEWLNTYASQCTMCQIVSLAYWQQTSFAPA